MQFGTCQNEVQLYLDARYISFYKSGWRIYKFHMHKESPNVRHLQVHVEEENLISWDEEQAPDTQTVMEQAASWNTTLSAYFKANEKYPNETKDLLYQDFPSKFVWQAKQ